MLMEVQIKFLNMLCVCVASLKLRKNLFDQNFCVFKAKAVFETRYLLLEFK